MKINKLKLTDFRIHENTLIDLDNQITVIVGSNGSGKTSIKDAIEYSFNGKNRLTDGRGSGADVMVNWDADKSLIKLYVDDLGCIKRGIPNELQVSDWSGKKTVQEKEMLKRLDTSKRAISAILNTTDFINLDSDEQQELIFNLAGLEFDKEDIIKEFLKWNQGEIDLSRDILLDIIPEGLQGGGEVFEDIYKKVYELRRKEKKKLKDIKGKFNNINSPDSKIKNISPEDKDEILKQYNDLSEERDKLFKTLGKLEADIDRKEDIEDDISTLKNNIEACQQKLDSSSLNVEDIDNLHEQKKSLIKKVQNHEEKISKLKSEYNQLRLTNRERKEAISSLENHNSNCPLAPEYINCPLSENEITNLISKIEDKLDIGKEKELKNLLDEHVNKKSKIDKKIDNITGEIDKLSTSIKEKEDIQQSLAEYKKELDNKVNELKEITDIDTVADLLEQIEKLDKRLDKGKQLIEDLNNAAELKKIYSQHEKSFKESKEKVDALELLVKAFKSSGIKSDLLGNVTDQLENEANKILAHLTDNKFKISFSTEGDNFLLVKKYEWPVFCNTDILSTSEKLRIGVIIQHVLNQLTGLKFLLIDKADTLDPQNRQLLINTVLNFRNEYDQIIILSTVGESKPQDPGIEGLKVWWLEDGNLKNI